MAANAAAIITWDKDADNGGTAFSLANLNCTVPMGVEINTLQTEFT